MANLTGRQAIADYLGMTGGDVARLVKGPRPFPIIFEGRHYTAKTEDLDAWKAERGKET